MTVIIQIHFISIDKSRAYRQGEFRIYGNRTEQAAFTFWKQIKKESPIELALEKVLVEKEDVTDLVKALEEQEWSKLDNNINDLPF